MNEWTILHPNLTFTLVFFCLIILHNVLINLIKIPEKSEHDIKTKKATESNDNEKNV